MVKKYTPTLKAVTGKPGAPVRKAVGSKTIKAGSTVPASGSKRVKVGAPKTAGKTVQAYTTIAQQARNEAAAAQAKVRQQGRVMTPSDGYLVRRNRLQNKPTTI